MSIALGEKHGKAKLTKKIILKIMDMSKNCISVAHLAKDIGLPYMTVVDVVRGHTWSHLTSLHSFKQLKVTLLTRFMQKVSFSNCWDWKACKTLNGYGLFCVTTKKKKLAHNVIWEIMNGPRPKGLLILHKCDNRGCVNPDHLFLGTYKDNMQDMVKKGRGRWQLGSQREAR